MRYDADNMGRLQNQSAPDGMNRASPGRAEPSGLLVVVCTWNERENLPQLAAEIRRSVPGAHVLVVDDGSPDGTGDWARAAAAESSDLHCLLGSQKQGLGAAAISGLRWGLDRGFRLIGTMDADLSHDPAALPALLRRLSDSSTGRTPDMVIGSRYVPGGRIEGWPLTRRILSRGANGFARIWLRLPVRDCTSGLRIYRSAILRQVDLDSVTSRGYAYLEELLLALARQGVMIAEEPICFRDRSAGRSKASLREVVRAAGSLVRLGLSRGPRRHLPAGRA